MACQLAHGPLLSTQARQDFFWILHTQQHCWVLPLEPASLEWGHTKLGRRPPIGQTGPGCLVMRNNGASADQALRHALQGRCRRCEWMLLRGVYLAAVETVMSACMCS